jgi:hypothetical protein
MSNTLQSWFNHDSTVGTFLQGLHTLPLEERMKAIQCSLHDLEAYIKAKKRQLRDEILAKLSQPMYYRETGELIELNDLFTEDVLEIGMSYKKFIKDLKNIGLYTKLIEYAHQRIMSNEFYTKNNNE